MKKGVNSDIKQYYQAHVYPVEDCHQLTLLYTEEDTKGVVRICKSKKDRQHNGQKKKYKKQSTKHTHKTKDWVTRTPLKSEGELR